MKPQEPRKIPPTADDPTPADPGSGTGEGAATALQALIRKRKQVEKPDLPDPEPPAAQLS